MFIASTSSPLVSFLGAARAARIRTFVSSQPLEAYQNRKGVCGHFANLMTALCRAAKIPAQSVSGLHLPPYPPLWSATRTWGSPGGTHGWVEFHTAEGWEMDDPSAAYRTPLKALSFGNNRGHLSYGERLAHARICEGMRGWAHAAGSMVGAMSGPLRFAAAADGKVSFLPQATVKVTWSSRWFYVVALVGLFLSGHRYCRWRQKRNAAGPTSGSTEPRESAAFTDEWV